MRLSAGDHARIAAAVGAAEAATDGEIVCVSAARSDKYNDVALHWALLTMLLVPALLAWSPALVLRALGRLDPWGDAPPIGLVIAAVLLLQAAVFLLARLLLRQMTLRLALTPAPTKARRVRRQALALFRVGVEARTRATTGVLLYLSLAERRAELVADAAIHARVDPAVWGEAMAALVGAVRDGRPADGIVAAVEQVGAVLAQHFPRSADDTNELPDRLVEL